MTDDDQVPAEMPTMQFPSLGGPPVAGDGGEPWDLAETDSGDEPWPARARPSGLSMRVPTAILLALLVAAGAFWGGAAVQRSDGTSSTASGFGAAAARLRSAFASGAFAGFGSGGASASGAGGASGGFGSASSGSTSAALTTAGTLTAVVGDTLYLTSASGAIVKVQLSPTTKVTRTAAATPAALKDGDSIDVEGTTAKDGTVEATSVSASAAAAATSSSHAAAGAVHSTPSTTGSGG